MSGFESRLYHLLYELGQIIYSLPNFLIYKIDINSTYTTVCCENCMLAIVIMLATGQSREVEEFIF